MKNSMSYFIIIATVAINFGLQALPTPAQQSQAKTNEIKKIENEKYDILKKDQIDSTDIYEIPFGDSEIEDEEELNNAEKKEVFKLPAAR